MIQVKFFYFKIMTVIQAVAKNSCKECFSLQKSSMQGSTTDQGGHTQVSSQAQFTAD